MKLIARSHVYIDRDIEKIANNNYISCAEARSTLKKKKLHTWECPQGP